MNCKLNKIKNDLLAFGEKHHACAEEYQRLCEAKSIEEVIVN